MIVSAKKEYVIDEFCPTPSCHASTVLPLDDGTVIAAWFGGEAEGNDNVDIWIARRIDGEWGKPECISADKGVSHWNPVLFRKKDGSVILFFKVGKKISDWQTFAVTSSDGGASWSEPYELVPGDASGGRGPVKNKPLRMADGTVLAPASSEQPTWLPFIDISYDDCVTWEKQGIIDSKKTRGVPVPMIQPTLWESAPGKVHAILRTSVRHAYRSDSEDGGKTWCKAYPAPVKNNNSGLDVTKMPDGSLILISNPVAKNWGDRAPLTLMRSTDNGNTWEEIFVLERRHDHEDEFSYPAIVNVGNVLHITYTWQRKKVAYWEIKIAD